MKNDSRYSNAITIMRKDQGQDKLNSMDLRRTVHNVLKQRHAILKSAVLSGFFK